MQKWEYLFVVGDFSGGAWRPRVINGKVIEDWKKGPTIYEASNQLGEQGWELVGFTVTRLIECYRLTFKRLKQ